MLHFMYQILLLLVNKEVSSLENGCSEHLNKQTDNISLITVPPESTLYGFLRYCLLGGALLCLYLQKPVSLSYCSLF